MIKFLVKISVFGILSVILLLSTILATEIEPLAEYLPHRIPILKGTTSHQWTRQREADTTQNIDILIVGSSLAQSIDVREFKKYNLRAFNLASGSQTPIQTSYLLDKYMDSMNPKLVLWDVHPFSFSYTGLESTVDLISNCEECESMVPMLVKTNSMLAFITYIKRMMLKPFEDSDFIAPRETDISKYIGAGYMETYFAAPEIPPGMDPFQFIGLEVQKKTFESELIDLKNRNVSVILVYSPKSTEYIKSFQNQQEWFDYFRSIHKQGLAEDFIDFNELFSDFPAKNPNFYDIAHLTALGSKKYNFALSNSLSQKLKYLSTLNTGH